MNTFRRVGSDSVTVDLDDSRFEDVDSVDNDETSSEENEDIAELLNEKCNQFVKSLLEEGLIPMGSTDLNVALVINNGDETNVEHDFVHDFSEEEQLHMFTSMIDNIMTLPDSVVDTFDYKTAANEIINGIVTLGSTIDTSKEIETKLSQLLRYSVETRNEALYSQVMRILMTSKKDVINIRSDYGLGIIYNFLVEAVKSPFSESHEDHEWESDPSEEQASLVRTPIA